MKKVCSPTYLYSWNLRFQSNFYGPQTPIARAGSASHCNGSQAAGSFFLNKYIRALARSPMVRF
jgi:hypothetical protein